MKQTETSAGLDFKGEKIPVLFAKIFFPTLVGMIFDALLTFTDGVFVGRGVGPDGIAAVNIIAPIFLITTGIGMMFGIGASVSAGIALAAGDTKKANSMVSSAFIFSTGLMCLLILLAALLPEYVAEMLGSSEKLMDNATGYLTYLLIGLVPLMWQNIGMMVIRLDGSPKYAMMCNVIPALVNLVLDWWFIFPLGMGVRGAALATSISCVIGGGMAVVYFRRSYVLKLTTHVTNFRRHVVTQAKIGSSAFVTEIAMSVMMFTGNIVFMRSFGESGVAAYSIACYLFPIIFMINNAVAQSAQPIISVNYGCCNIARVYRTLKTSLIVGSICGLLATAGIVSGARSITTLFISPDTEAAQIAISGLPIFATAGIFFALNIAFIGYYQSIERPMPALAFTLMRGVAVLVPMFFLLSYLFPERGMWAAIPTSEAVTLIVILATFRHKKSSTIAPMR